MYIVTVLGIIVSFIYRAIYLIFSDYLWRRRGFSRVTVVSFTCSKFQRFHGLRETTVYLFVLQNQVLWLESIVLASSGCVLVVLIFLCTVARLALKSTRNQVHLELISHFCCRSRQCLMLVVFAL